MATPPQQHKHTPSVSSFLKGVREYVYPVLQSSAFLERCVGICAVVSARCVIRGCCCGCCCGGGGTIPDPLCYPTDISIASSPPPQGRADPAGVRGGGRPARVPLPDLELVRPACLLGLGGRRMEALICFFGCECV